MSKNVDRILFCSRRGIEQELGVLAPAEGQSTRRRNLGDDRG